MITATKNSSNLISAHHQYEYPAHPSMHGRTLSMASSTGEGGEDLLFAGMSGCFEDEDGISFDDLEQESRDGLGPLDASTTSSSSHANGAAANGMAKKGKKLTSTAEKKATHNAVERARRESLNTRFLVLADMLPGMNHVKRASKAAIVNKSIALIQDLQANEQKLNAENEALKAELAILRQRVASGSPPAAPVPVPGPAGPSPFSGIPAAAAFAMPGMPMIPGMPAMMHPGMQMPPSSSSAAATAHEEAIRRASMEAAAAAAAAAAASSSANGMPHLYPLGMHNYFGAMPNNLPIVESPTSTSAAIPAVKAESTGSPNSVYSQSIGATIPPFHHQHHHQQQQATPAHLASELFPHGLFDFGMTNAGITGSPAPSWTNGASPPCSTTDAAGAAAAANKPPGSSSAASSGPPGLSLGQSSAASPAGSQSSASTSITTPANTFSPIPLPSQHLLHHQQHQQCFDGAASTTSSGTSPPAAAVAAAASANANAVAAMAAFGENADPALLAAQFGPAELAKAQSELSAFIAYQQRMAGFAAAAAAAAAAQQQQQHTPATAGSAPSYQNGAPQPTPSPTETTSFNLPAPQQQQQQQQRLNASPVSANNNANAAALAAQAAAMGTMPAAWQMMLAQHHQQAQFAAHHQQQHSQHQAQAAAAAAAMGVAGFGGQY